MAFQEVREDALPWTWEEEAEVEYLKEGILRWVVVELVVEVDVPWVVPEWMEVEVEEQPFHDA